MRSLALCVLAAVAAAAPVSAATLVVRPGQSIQAAVDRAAPGDTVLVLPGLYHETGRPCPTNPSATCAVVVTQDDLRLVGARLLGHGPVLEALPNQDQGIAVAKNGADGATCIGDPNERVERSLVSGFVVKDFAGEGIFHFCVDGFDVRGNLTRNNAEYGIFPSHSAHGVVAGNVATGSNDTGIYIGQSRDVRIIGNLAQANVSGFEIENSTDVVLEENAAIGNTGGILSFTLPFLDVGVNSGNRIAHNLVLANNKPNTCLDPSDSVCAVPPGTGILLVAADQNVVENNAVIGNDSFGIAVSNFCVAQQLPPDVCAILDIQPDPDGNRIARNLAVRNGHDPSPLVPSVLAVDLAWDGTGTDNCWAGNVSQTRFPDPLPTCP